MACEARSGLKHALALQWHLFPKSRKQAHPEAPKQPQRLQVSVKRGGCLLQSRDGQVFSLA